jgi:hypothetical protein
MPPKLIYCGYSGSEECIAEDGLGTGYRRAVLVHVIEPEAHIGVRRLSLGCGSIEK